MSDWVGGGWTGSIAGVVRKEMKDHFISNPVAAQARYGLTTRVLRRFYSIQTFGRFVSIYAFISVVLLSLEAWAAFHMACSRPKWLQSQSFYPLGDTATWPSRCGPPTWLSVQGVDDLRSYLLDVGSYLIGAQVGALGILSLALALVTLIAQRENAETDVQVYYHEAMAFELVASSIALVSVLCVQLFWPAHLFLKWVWYSADLGIFKLVSLGVHLTWLIINLTALAHFIAVTFGFVQQKRRQRLRELFTANVVMPRNFTARYAYILYSNAAASMGAAFTSGREPSVLFGYDYGPPNETEIQTRFSDPVALVDVRLRWVKWVVRRWIDRTNSLSLSHTSALPPAAQGPLLTFTPVFNKKLRGSVDWCLRQGGAPLTRFERFVLRKAFVFKKVRGES